MEVQEFVLCLVRCREGTSGVYSPRGWRIRSLSGPDAALQNIKKETFELILLIMLENILAISLLSILASAQQCISLQASTQCYEYKNYSIIPFTGVQNAAEFDAYIVSQSAFTFPNCAGWNKAKPFKYSRTFVCGWSIYYSTTLASASQRCNQNGAPPTPICQASAQTALADVHAELQKLCPSQQMYPQYTSFANSISNSNCLLGIGQDLPLKCGFANPSDATAYCQSNANALCCTSPSNLVGVSPSAAPSTSTNTTTSTAPLTAPLTTSTPSSINPNSDSISTDESSSSSSSATPSSTAEASSSPPGGSLPFSPFVIGAVALGLALVAVIGSVIYFRNKKKEVSDGAQDEYNGKPMMAASGATGLDDSKADTMECVYEYKANLFDELSLEVGDEVAVINKYDDGWAIGRNLNTGKEGTFPLACLAPLGSGSEYRDSRFESQYSKRDSSIRYTVDSSAYSRPY